MMMLAVPVLLMGMLASVASFCLKKAAAGGRGIPEVLRTPFLYLGGGVYLLSALLNLYLLRRLPYSLVVPLGSLTYLWTLLLAHRFLAEPITGRKLAGILLILLGVCFTAGAL